MDTWTQDLICRLSHSWCNIHRFLSPQFALKYPFGISVGLWHYIPGSVSQISTLYTGKHHLPKKGSPESDWKRPSYLPSKVLVAA